MNIPVRQHYIPQFILRNFCFKNNFVKYFDIEENTVKTMNIKDIFMEKQLYDDNINNYNFPQQIEKDLSIFENEIALIINNKFLKENTFKLSQEEFDKLSLFFAIMAFRNINTKEQFLNYSTKSKESFSIYQPDLNYIDFWKRNLCYLVKCRSLDEVIKNKKIDDPIKLFMTRDIFNFTGKYFLLFEKRGKNSFIIGDCYPTDITGDFLNMHSYSYFPISPDRLLLIVSKGVESIPSGILTLDKKDLKCQLNDLSISVKKLYDDKINKINDDIIKNCKIGYILTEEE